MVYALMCDCVERTEVEIDSLKLFQKMRKFFEMQVEKGIFLEEEVRIPYYVWKGNNTIKEWFATKWYRCKVCGCLWEFNYPDFPACGFIRKFSNGIYITREY